MLSSFCLIVLVFLFQNDHRLMLYEYYQKRRKGQYRISFLLSLVCPQVYFLFSLVRPKVDCLIK